MKYNLNRIISLIIFLAILSIGCHKKNRPPHTPYTPTGPSVGKLDIKYNFSSLAIDPDDDSITIRFDWGDGDTSVWLSDLDIWVASEQTFTLPHSWTSLDTFYIRAQAKDKKDNISEWSMPHRLIITPNHPPNIPSISGPSSGYIQTSYQFSSSTTDSDGDSIAIRFDWGDGDTSEWSKLIPSGDSVQKSNSWVSSDTYYVRAQAKDKYGQLSGWSELASIIIGAIAWICATDSAGWTPRESHASVVFHDKMWVIGGHERPDEVWTSSDGVNWTCETNSAGFGERDDHRAVVFDDKIWVIAGSHGNPMNDVWCSADGRDWTQVIDSAPWSPRWDHSAIVFNNKIWLLGGIGRNIPRCYDDVWYSADGVDWTRATRGAEWGARGDHTSAVFDNKIWVMGGVDSPGHVLNDVWYSSDGVNWTQATASAGWSCRIGHASVIFDNKIWVLGGIDLEVGPRNDVWFSTDGEFWVSETLQTIFPERWGHTSVVFDNKIWVMGGFGSQGELLNDVWYRDILYGK